MSKKSGIEYDLKKIFSMIPENSISNKITAYTVHLGLIKLEDKLEDKIFKKNSKRINKMKGVWSEPNIQLYESYLIIENLLKNDN